MPWKRLRHYLEIIFLTFLLSGFFLWQNSFLLDRILVYVTLDALFLAVLLYMLESCRLRLQLGNSASDQYAGITKAYAVFCVITAGCYFLPEFTFSAAAAALFLGIVSAPEISIGFCLYLCVIFCMASGANFYELASEVILTLIGAQMSKTMHEKKLRLWGFLILTASSVCIPSLFYNLVYEDLYWQRLFFFLCGQTGSTIKKTMKNGMPVK